MSTALFATPDVNKLIKEITTMLSFDHPNVMTLIGVSLDRESPLLIMPFMSKGSVLEYVKHHKEELLHTSEAETAQVGHKIITQQHTHITGARYLLPYRSQPQGKSCLVCLIRLQREWSTCQSKDLSIEIWLQGTACASDSL